MIFFKIQWKSRQLSKEQNAKKDLLESVPLKILKYEVSIKFANLHIQFNRYHDRSKKTLRLPIFST